MAKDALHKPGEDNQLPGRWLEVGLRGGDVGGRTVNIDRGDRLPPTQKPNRRWKHL